MPRFVIYSSMPSAILKPMLSLNTFRHSSSVLIMKRAIVVKLATGIAVVFSFSNGTGATANTGPSPSLENPTPTTPREFYNAGTREFEAGKFREAEALFEGALASQNERLQTPALYNLGHVRFAQGTEELKKGPSAQSAASRSEAASEQGEAELRAIDDALASNDLDKMVAAYLHGRGQRRELKAARTAVMEALKAHQATLAKWERASADFKSAVELTPTETDARVNADVVDRRIARLIDSLRQIQQSMRKCTGMCDKLGNKLKQLKGRIPGAQIPGGAGDDEEEEEAPLGQLKDHKEAASKDGKEMLLSPEQAGWLLEGFRLDSERRLPMGQEKPGQPKARSLKPW